MQSEQSITQIYLHLCSGNGSQFSTQQLTVSLAYAALVLRY